MGFSFQKAKERQTKGNCKSPDWWDFIWVVYSLFYFIEPIARNERGYWIQFAVVYAIFLSIYTGSVLARARWQNYLLLVALTLLGIYFFPDTQGAEGMFISVAAVLPFSSEPLV